MGIAAEDEIVMREMLIALVQTQIQHDAGTGGFVFAALLELRADAAVDQFAMRANGIAVGDDSPEGDFLALIRANAGDRAVLREDPFDSGAGAEFDAEFAREFRQRRRHGARAAHRIPDAFIVLHVRDAAQHGGRTVGRRADVLREVIHHLRDARIGIERAHRARDAAAHAHREHIAEQLGVEGRFEIKHVAQSADGFVEEVALRDAD